MRGFGAWEFLYVRVDVKGTIGMAKYSHNLRNAMADPLSPYGSHENLPWSSSHLQLITDRISHRLSIQFPNLVELLS